METEPEKPRWRASNPAELGRVLARLRRARKLTQEQMATVAGVHRSYLARMEGGLVTS